MFRGCASLAIASLLVLLGGNSADGFRSAGPPRRARAGAGEHARRLRQGAGDRRHDAGDRPRRHQGRRDRAVARSGAQPGHRARARWPVARRAGPRHQQPDTGGAETLRRRPHQAGHQVRADSSPARRPPTASASPRLPSCSISPRLRARRRGSTSRPSCRRTSPRRRRTPRLSRAWWSRPCAAPGWHGAPPSSPSTGAR